MTKRTEAIKLRIPVNMYRALRDGAKTAGVSVAALIRYYVGSGLQLPPSEHHPRPYARRRAKRS